MSEEQAVADRVASLAAILEARRWRISTAESCTGGWLAKILTDRPGSSAWFEFGFVTYSNEAKLQLLGVRAASLAGHGAVSQAVAEEMALGARRQSQADVAVAITGIAGPSGGTEQKPVGTVWLAWAWGSGQMGAEKREFPGDRAAVRLQSVAAALDGTLARLSS
jgi:nicotinamide-nucleotide amidase